uniref:Uncharacterized protein n=1 Tax=Chenopodium quinoa TaxID=63459 RepID=A0A803L576_CHEQI
MLLGSCFVLPSAGCCIIYDLKSLSLGENIEDYHDEMMLSTPFMGYTPFDNLDVHVSSIIKEKMTQALRCFKESTEQNQILVQIWAPIKSGNQYVLTTTEQPFVLGRHSNGLNQYRSVSLMYMFSIDDESVATHGLPARVFRQKMSEWSPNFQYYTSKEYPQVSHAKHYNIRGTLALPIFEPSGKSCVGVLELVMTSQKINYAPEVDKICKALEAVNLKSSQIPDHQNIQVCNVGRQNALAEILEVLTELCETYKLPLAQTWVPCRHRCVLAYGGGPKQSCSSFDGSCIEQVSLSTSDVAFYVVDAHMWGFREACAEHHLQKGQGVAGGSFSSHGLSYCRDISQFCKIEYPLVHYARMFGLTGSFAICLRSKHTGDDDYILEFFLPLSLKDTEQLNLLGSILATMRQNLQNLMVASGRTLEEERSHKETIEVSVNENLDLQVESNLSTRSLSNNNINKDNRSVAKLKHVDEYVQVNDGTIMTTHSSDDEIILVDMEPLDRQLTSETGSSDDEIFLVGENNLSSLQIGQSKMTTDVNAKAEKKISMEDIVPLFSLKLVDAAKQLGVSRSTLKRKCRQFKINRWPSSTKKNVKKFRSKPGSASIGSAQMNSSTPANPLGDEQNLEFLQDSNHGPSSARLDGTCIIFTVKAKYKEDLIKFSFSSTFCFTQLKEEVSKRLNLDSSSFKIKYHDDDDDLVLITCDSDLQYFLCNLELSKSKAID